MLIDSAPPAMMICAPPERMRSAAMAMACSPEEQKRLMVTPGTVSGRPARSAATRAMFMPDSPSGLAQPRMTSSISSRGHGGILFQQAADDGRGQIVGPGGAERALRGFADGGAKTIDDDGLFMVYSSAFARVRTLHA